MAAVLRDLGTLNMGYQYVVLDDRLLLADNGDRSQRRVYDRDLYLNPELFQAYGVRDGYGLVVLPIAYNLRQSVPLRCPEHWNDIKSQVGQLTTIDPSSLHSDLVAIYADDMEKPVGVGRDTEGPARSGRFQRVDQRPDTMSLRAPMQALYRGREGT